MSEDYYGLPAQSVGNQHLRLQFLTTAGPRIVRLWVAGSDKNVLAEVPTFGWDTPYGRYAVHGGHRLWYAPEEPSRTYLPDDNGLLVEELPDGVCLTQPVEPHSGIRKCIEVRLHEGRPALTVRHELRNEGSGPIELAPWAITQFPLGGTAVLPLRARESVGLLPNRHLVLWPYAHWDDPRLSIRDDALFFQARPHATPFKIGMRNDQGWLGYWRDGLFFRKRFLPQPDRPLADWGCNTELYCNDNFVELETLGPLECLETSQSVAHIEEWEVFIEGDKGQALNQAMAAWGHA